MTKLVFRCGAILYAVVLASCVSAPDPTGIPALQIPKDATGWSVQGKAALTNAEGTQTISVRWVHPDHENDRVRLSGPLGAGAIELYRTGERLYWINDELEQPLSALPMHSEARSAALNLPLATVSNWLLGYPDDVDGWTVDVTQWQQVDDWRLPRKIQATRADTSLKLVLLSWNLAVIP